MFSDLRVGRKVVQHKVSRLLWISQVGDDLLEEVEDILLVAGLVAADQRGSEPVAYGCMARNADSLRRL